HDQETGDVARNGRNHAAEDQSAYGLTPPIAGAYDARRVGAEAEEHGMAKGDDAGIAKDQIDREREKRRDRHLARKAEIGWKQIEGCKRGNPEQDLKDGPAAAPANPPGRLLD